MRTHRGEALRMVQAMIERDPVCVHQADKYGQTALFQAVQMGDLELVLFLITEGRANLDVKINNPGSDDHGKTLLWYAVENENLDIITVLSQLGAPIMSPRGEMQFMPIHYLVDQYFNMPDVTLQAQMLQKVM